MEKELYAVCLEIFNTKKILRVFHAQDEAEEYKRCIGSPCVTIQTLASCYKIKSNEHPIIQESYGCFVTIEEANKQVDLLRAIKDNNYEIYEYYGD